MEGRLFVWFAAFCYRFSFFWIGFGGQVGFLNMAVSLFTHFNSLHISFSSFCAASLAGFEIDEILITSGL